MYIHDTPKQLENKIKYKQKGDVRSYCLAFWHTTVALQTIAQRCICSSALQAEQRLGKDQRIDRSVLGDKDSWSKAGKGRE